MYLAVGQHQHPQGPQSSEGSRANLAQIVSSQLQQPRAVWEAPGNMLEPTATAVHQVSVLVTDALVGTQLCALDEWEKGWGRIKGKEDKEKCREQETHRLFSERDSLSLNLW